LACSGDARLTGLIAPKSRFRRGAVPWGEAGACPGAVFLPDRRHATSTALVSAPASPRCARWDALPAGTSAALGSCRPGGTLRSTNPPSSSRHARRARAVTAKGGTKVHAATIILHDRLRRRARAPAREGVRERLDSGTRHSDTAGRATRQGRPASRFHVRCPPVGVHPLSFLNDLIRPSTPSNPRSFGPSCRCAAARTTPSIGVPLRV